MVVVVGHHPRHGRLTMSITNIITEYAGTADRQVGWGVTHEVRAFWNALDDYSERQVAAHGKRELKASDVTGRIEYIGRDLSTYNSPSLSAMLRYRVLTDEQHARRAELRTRVYKRCDGCGGSDPGQLVYMFDDTTGNPERALCYTCWRPLAVTVQCKVLYWIKADGKLQV
jgi:hypothetical protein